MRVIEVYIVISESKQAQEVIAEMRNEWIVADTVNNNSGNFKQPSAETVDARRFKFPLKVLDYVGRFHQWIVSGAHDDFGATAIVERDNGSVEEVPVKCVCFLEPEQ